MAKIQIPKDYKPRPYQSPLWDYLASGGKRAVAVWHRRAGKDITSMNWTIYSAFNRPGLYWHLLPTYQQGRKIVWDGITRDGKAFLDHWPEELVTGVNNTEMKLELKNGSIWQVVGTDNVDRLVGANPVGCKTSEYSLQDPRAWDYIRPILAENGGWAVFIYTPRGRNHGHKLLQLAKKNDNWFAETLAIDNTKCIPMSAIEEERAAGMAEELIQQEFYASFDAPLVGSYYGDAMTKTMEEGRICKVPYDSRLPVHTAWDIGMHDATAIWFFQINNREVWIIDYYEDSGKGLEDYAAVLKEKMYTYGDHIAPHDIAVRELGTGKSRQEVALNFGIRFRIAPQIGIQDGISAVRQVLPRCWFDEDRCERGIDAMKQYRKEFDDKRGMYREKPNHDWTSHGADAFRYLAVGMREERDLSELPAFADMEYAII